MQWNDSSSSFEVDAREDYPSLRSNIFRSFWLNVQPLIHYLSDAFYRMSDQIK